MSAAPQVALRPAGPDDEALLLEVYASTRDEELRRLPWTAAQRAAFVAQQAAAQRAHMRSRHPHAVWHVVLVDGEPAGRLCLERRERELAVLDVALLAPFRGRGAGRRLLEGVLAEAAAAGSRVTLHVERDNPARRLYERLGFVEVGEQGIHLALKWTPQTAERPAPAGG